jgi:signal transduction histidine kinase
MWRDWFVFGVRWLVIAGYTLLETSGRSSLTLTQELINALLIAAAANCFLGFILSLRSGALITPVTVVTDWIIAAAFIWIGRSSAAVVVGVAVVSMLLTLIRPSPWYSLTYVAGLAPMLVFTWFGTLEGAEISAAISGELALPLIILGLFSGLIVLLAHILDRQINHHQRLFAARDAERSAQIDEVRERARAIYEMTTTFRETQSFERILNAALDAGQLGLRGRMSRNLVAAVLLFQVEEPGLTVVAARRFTRTDMFEVVPGKNGIIADALRDGVPIIGERGKHDPELQRFIAFQMTRAILCVPLRAGYENFGVLIYGSETQNAFTEEHRELLTAIGVQATIALHNYVLYRSLQEEKERITRVAEDERKQLARQLHDGPTQKVSAIAMMTNVARRMLERTPERVPEELSRMEEIARTTSKEMRHMLFTLRPLVLESQGLAAALQQLAEKMRETHGQNVEMHIQAGVERYLDAHKQAVVFHLIEEAVNNARKHAQATLISVDIARQNRDLVVTISDNGVGFNVAAVEDNYVSQGSLGLVTMRERAALLDGTLHIASEPKVGTTISVIAPLVPDKPKPKVHDDTIVEIPLEKLKVGNARGRAKDARQRANPHGSLIHE